MSVKDNYCLDGWEKYFISKPLSFNEFVDQSSVKEFLYPHIKNTINLLSNHAEVTQLYIQGCVGSGKSMIVKLYSLYKVYLYMLLKNPSSTFSLSSCQETAIYLFGDDESNNLLINSLISELNKFSSIFQSVNKFTDNPSKIEYMFDYDDRDHKKDCFICFNYHGVKLRSYSFLERKELLGKNIIIGIAADLSFVAERTGLSNTKIFDVLQKLKYRIDSRFTGNPISLFLVDKDPNNLWNDPLDQMMINMPEIKDHTAMIRYTDYWKLYTDKITTDKVAYISLSTGKVSDDKPEDMGDWRAFPNIDFLRKEAEENPVGFIKDFIGIPCSIGQLRNMEEAINEIKTIMMKNHISLLYKNNRMYLEANNGQVMIPIDDHEDE